MTRKSLMTFVLFCLLCGFSFRAGERNVMAVDPNPCPNGCTNVYGWVTVAHTPGECSAVEVAGTTRADTKTHTSYAINIIYSQVVTGGTAKTNGAQVDKWTYPGYGFQCGKENGKWQMSQQVSPSGVGKLDTAGINQLTCQ